MNILCLFLAIVTKRDLEYSYFDIKNTIRIGILFGAVLRFELHSLTELGLVFLGRAELHSSDLPLLYSNFLINSIALYLTPMLPISDAWRLHKLKGYKPRFILEQR